MSLLPLLQILKNPASPTFTQALAKLAEIDPATLPKEELPLLLAQLENTIASLQTSKSVVVKELEALRNQGRAIQSYKVTGK